MPQRRLLSLCVQLLACGGLPALAVTEPCDAVHPAPPAWWTEATTTCQRGVHVISAEPRAAEVVFSEWDQLLLRVRQTPLASLALRPAPVHVHVYMNGAQCREDLDLPFAAACYQAQRQLARVGFNRWDEGGEERFREIVRHELAHHLLFGARDDAPRWVSEGFAEFFEPLADASLSDAPPELPLAELLAWEGPNTAGVGVSYKAARTLVGGLLSSREHGEAFADRVLSSSAWPRGLNPLLSELDLEVADLHRVYRRQRTWREGGAVGRHQQRLAAALTTSWGGEPWMLGVGALLLAVLGASLRVARS